MATWWATATTGRAPEASDGKITCIDKDIKGALESGYYIIPRFQRPYLWDRENVEEFWADAVVDTEGEHFIGSIVVLRSKDGKMGVVDGQQRLTTVTMTLCALRNAFESHGFGDLARGIHRLVERPHISDRAQYILQPETSYPYFQEYVQKFGPPEASATMGQEEALLRAAFEFISGNIQSAANSVLDDRSLSDKRKITLLEKKLKEIRDRILGLKLMFIELDQEDDAYVIFETLNTRGKELRLSDLVKNHLTRLMKPKNVNVDLAKEKWNQMVELIEQSSAELTVDNFLHHYWLSRHEYTTSKKLFKSLKKRVKRADASSFLDEISLDAKTYREIHETSYCVWAAHELRMKRSLDALSTFRVKQDLPMILSLMREYRAGNLSRKHVERALAAIESFHFMFTAITSQRSSGGISFMYAMHARELTAATGVPDKLATIDELVRKLRDKKPSYQEFEANFVEKRYSKKYPKDKKLVQYILAGIDRHRKSVGVLIDYPLMAIEHLAPENPLPGRATTVSDGVVAEIGNLVLVDEELNRRLSNKRFAEKKSMLMESPVWVDDLVRDADTWGEQEIRARSRYLAGLAFNEVWSF